MSAYLVPSRTNQRPSEVAREATPVYVVSNEPPAKAPEIDAFALR
ncbi:hypothetical protein PF008_g29429 [Phytophthora fragariae]|uniref:Uncharacterized protein n=1 Tax=Phytophthora fragariae TaxID=53985 RepID=A0A6G0Q995_9STRA|nr:hypothetical protein PF008_g29429 [Phytophthora fragariae]